MKRIKKNMVMCNHCGEVIESKYRHDYATCGCGKVSIDGGKDYLRRNAASPEDYKELSEYEEVDEEVLIKEQEKRAEAYKESFLKALRYIQTYH